MTAHFLGRSGVKYTGKWHRATRELPDYQIRITGLPEFPYRVTLRNKEVRDKKTKCWEYPPRHDAGHLVVRPTDKPQMVDIYFADEEPFTKYFNPYDPMYFLEVTSLDAEDGDILTTQLVDAREQLSVEEEHQVLQELFDKWPPAVPEEMICDVESEEDKNIRAEEILLNFINTDMRGMRFLDCGCGEGHLAKFASKTAAMSVGYDIGVKETVKENNFLLTSDFAQVKKHAPYDYILLFDTLDHADDPGKLLKDLTSVSKANTIIKIRCHPYSSRHGAHQYRKLNLAYLHIVLRPEEFEQHGLEPKPVEIYNESDYRQWFSDIGAVVNVYKPVRTTVEGFFQKGLVKKRIIDNGIQDFDFLEIEFIDFEVGFRQI
ncbi:MAG: methyltransferase domain-containing protein [Candidatus Hermodarchaeia archaeon]